MRPRSLLPLGVGIAASCALLQPRFEAVDPEYGYVDGCVDIVLQGAQIGEDATVTIGGVELLSIEPATYDDALPEHAQDVGFKYFGLTGAAPDLEPGFYDVVMTVPPEDGKGDPAVRTLHKGFYFLACPGPVHVEALGLPPGEADSGDTAAPPPAPIAPGATVPVEGCGLDEATVVAELRDAAGVVVRTAPLVSDCLTARAHFTVPSDTVPGDYFLVFANADGYLDGYACVGDTGAHTGDSGTDTGATCVYTRPITVAGGAP